MLRITGGELKGHSLLSPSGLSTRPSQAKLREALFSSVQAITQGARVLDLFAGSGALGFEALSRGAEKVVFVDSAIQSITVLKRNGEKLGLENRIEILKGAVPNILNRCLEFGPFDLILADPPYEKGFETVLLQNLKWEEFLNSDGLFCLEWRKGRHSGYSTPDTQGVLVKVREKNYGESILTTYRRKE